MSLPEAVLRISEGFCPLDMDRLQQRIELEFPGGYCARCDGEWTLQPLPLGSNGDLMIHCRVERRDGEKIFGASGALPVWTLQKTAMGPPSTRLMYLLVEIQTLMNRHAADARMR